MAPALTCLAELERRVTATPEGRALLDANLPAARGYCLFQLGDFTEAKLEYERAVAREPGDPTNLAAVLVCRLRCGEPVDLAKAFAAIDATTLLAGDDVRIGYAKATAEALRGDSASALARMLELIERDGATADMHVECANLVKASNPEHAFSILERARLRYPGEARPLVFLGALYLERKDGARAEECFSTLERLSPPNWQYQYEAMRGLWDAGARARAHRIAQRIVNGSPLGLPNTPQAFFIAGAANWLLERYERAEYDFERSQRPERWHYRNWV